MSVRRTGAVLAVFLVVATAALGGWILRLRRGGGVEEGKREVTGLQAPVQVLRDSLGVPHVWATSVEDALTAQGYLHARDRLWQMEVLRRVVEGRLSELFGHRTLSSDRFLRALGLEGASEATVEAMDPRTRGMMDAYVRGVNAAIRGWRGPLPPELVALRSRPEPWSPVLAQGIEKVMAWDLTAYGADLSLAEARRTLGPERYRVVQPRDPAWGLTVEQTARGEVPPMPLVDGSSPPGAVEAPRAPIPGHDTDGAAAPWRLPEGRLLASARVPEPLRRLLEPRSSVRASNAWVVGGSRSRSGKPLVANDMHLGLEAPTLWYLMGLHAPGLDAVGLTLPGSLGVLAGRSAGVAWGFSNAYLDDGDFFIERVDPADSTRYLTPEGSRPFRVRVEVIRVADGPPDTVRVRETRHGPIMTPVESRAGEDLLAYRWVAHDPSTTASAVLDMNRARTAREFVDALSGFTDPHQNVVFADTAGTFGYWMAGRLPLRASGRPPLLPVPGWTGEHDWVGYLAFEEHPHAVNPPSGYVVTANNRQARDSVGGLVSPGRWARPFRAQRIAERIRAEEVHDAASMADIQLDVASAFARRYRPAAVRAFRDAGLDSAAAALEAWDLRSERAGRTATLFYAWIGLLQLHLETWLYGEEGGYLPLVAVERLLAGEVPDASGLPSAAAPRALEEARDRLWGAAHQLVLVHPLETVEILDRLFGFGHDPVAREGAHYTVNVAAFGKGPPPWQVTSGPSQRHVSDLADPDGRGGFILPGGQSGFPGHPHAWDQLPRWRRGELWRLPGSRPAVEARTTSRLVLEPAGTPD